MYNASYEDSFESRREGLAREGSFLDRFFKRRPSSRGDSRGGSGDGDNSRLRDEGSRDEVDVEREVEGFGVLSVLSISSIRKYIKTIN